MAESFADMLARNYALMGANATDGNLAALSGSGWGGASHADLNAGWQPTAAAQAAVPNWQGAAQPPAQPAQQPAQQPGVAGPAYGAAPMGATGGLSFGGAGGAVGGMPANPYLPGMADDITRRTTDMMNHGISNARGGALMAGGFGGSAQGIMEGKAIEGASDALSGNLTQMYGGAWNSDQNRDLQRYQGDQGFYTQQRGQDMQGVGLGLTAMNQGLAAPWMPAQQASGLYGQYTGFGSNTNSQDSGGGWQSALGGLLAGGSLGQQLGWFK